MSDNGKPAIQGAQLEIELFINEFQTITGLPNTNTIELFDALPLYHAQAHSVPTDAPRREEIEFRKRKITVTVKPAGVVIDGKMLYTFAGSREQLVEATLRKMFSEPNEHLEFVQGENGDMIPRLSTTPYAIRKRLSEAGHGFKLSEIREALAILSDTKFLLTVDDNGEPVDIEHEHPVIGRSHRTPKRDLTGKRSLEHITLHPLVLKSIVERTYRQLDWHRYTGLARPGARWLYARLVHHFTGVERGGGFASRPYNIDLDTILASSGMRRYSGPGGIKDNIRQVRLDLAELKDQGILDPLRPYVERLKKVKDPDKRGPARMMGAVWELYASAQTAEEIIATNVRMKTARLADEQGGAK